MQPAGLAAYEARRENRVGIYSYEQRQVELPEPYRGLFQANAAAWEFFNAQPPGYRKKRVLAGGQREAGSDALGSGWSN